MRPTNAAARAELSARAIRFYVASGLLDRPDGTGTAATYHYRHLLQVLFIKVRQREGQMLETIKNELRDLAGDALERRVALSLAPALGVEADRTVATDDQNEHAWLRVPVATGIEIHVRDDSPAASADGVTAMREAVRAALGRAELR